MTRQCCPCWAEVSLHDGHCCFRDYPAEPYNGPTLCGHDTEGRELMAAYKSSMIFGTVGTGAGRGGDPAQTEATLWVNGSVDCPEAPAQAHRPEPCPECGDELDPCTHGRMTCTRECWPNGCQLCIADLEDDLADERYEAMRDHQEIRDE